MANENKNINELAAGDDDPTVELEVIDLTIDGTDLSEADAKTFDVNRDTGDDTISSRISAHVSERSTAWNTISNSCTQSGSG